MIFTLVLLYIKITHKKRFFCKFYSG